jgi:AbiV family abortive infection protein
MVLKADLTNAIDACIVNGQRLLDDAMWLDFPEPPATKLVISMIAQEEFAKAFLLFLVREGIINWSKQLLRAMNDHTCKQLVGAVMDYVIPPWDESFEDMVTSIEEEFDRGDNLPCHIADAISILRYEKIGRWESSAWSWVDPPEYESSIKKVAEGARDRIKQDALYVRIGADGKVISQPVEVASEACKTEFERAGSYHSFVASLVSDGHNETAEYLKIKGFMTLLFAEKLVPEGT